MYEKYVKILNFEFLKIIELIIIFYKFLIDLKINKKKKLVSNNFPSIWNNGMTFLVKKNY